MQMAERWSEVMSRTCVVRYSAMPLEALSLSTFGLSWEVFASLAFKEFVRLLESKESQLAELSGQSASISDKQKCQSKTFLLIWKIQDCFAPWMPERRSTYYQEMTSRRTKVSKSLYFLPFSPRYTSSCHLCAQRIFLSYRRCNFVGLF